MRRAHRAARRRTSCAECRGGFALTAFAPALPSPLRKTAPYGRPVHRLGDCAGRSPGSRVVALLVRPSQFPSGRVGPKARRSQLRGQPRITPNSKTRIRSVRVPSFVPGITRGTSTLKCSLERGSKSSHALGACPHAPVSRSCYSRASGIRYQSRIVFFVSAGFALL
jgi:hypothetical protein